MDQVAIGAIPDALPALVDMLSDGDGRVAADTLTNLAVNGTHAWACACILLLCTVCAGICASAAIVYTPFVNE